MPASPVWAAMQTIRPLRRTLDRSLALAFILLVATAVAGCSSAAAPAESSSPSIPPSQPAAVDPNTPVGIDVPPAHDDPLPVEPDGRVVTPKPGQLDVHPISAQALSATVDGRRVVLTIDFTSGVEPCYVLDSIVVQRGAGSFAITLREGHGPGDVACIEIAEFKRVLVDLGELEPGTYTVSDATGGAAPITVIVN